MIMLLEKKIMIVAWESRVVEREVNNSSDELYGKDGKSRVLMIFVLRKEPFIVGWGGLGD